MINLFCGYDEREAIGYHVFCASVLRHNSRPVSFIPMSSLGLRQGTNAFTLSRFLVPFMTKHSGHAIFADASDMVMLADIARLDDLFDPQYAVQLVKHADYQTRHPMKYVGTPMQCENRDYPRKNWTSLMIINCEHAAWRGVTPSFIGKMPTLDALQLRWIGDDAIGALPAQWNVLVDEGQSADGAKLLHWTAGIPGFYKYRDAPEAKHWHSMHSGLKAA